MIGNLIDLDDDATESVKEFKSESHQVRFNALQQQERIALLEKEELEDVKRQFKVQKDRIRAELRVAKICNQMADFCTDEGAEEPNFGFSGPSQEVRVKHDKTIPSDRTEEERAQKPATYRYHEIENSSSEMRNSNPEISEDRHGLSELAKVFKNLSKTIQQGPLPSMVVKKFNRDVQDFHRFIVDFDTSYANRVTDPASKVSFLVNNCTGKAHDAIKFCLTIALRNPEFAYASARRILFEQFGYKYRLRLWRRT